MKYTLHGNSKKTFEFYSFCRKTAEILPWTKKEPSPRFAARRTLFHRVISWSMMHDQRRANVADSRGWLCPALIVRHRAWYHKIEQRSSRRESRDGSFFVQGSMLFKTCVDFGCYYGDQECAEADKNQKFVLKIISFKLPERFNSVAKGVLEIFQEV